MSFHLKRSRCPRARWWSASSNAHAKWRRAKRGPVERRLPRPAIRGPREVRSGSNSALGRCRPNVRITPEISRIARKTTTPLPRVLPSSAAATVSRNDVRSPGESGVAARTAPVDRAEEGLASPLEIELSADSIECRPTASGAGVGAPRGKAPTAATLPGPPASLGPRGA
jgi:hypothetical protein